MYVLCELEQGLHHQYDVMLVYLLRCYAHQEL